MPCRAGDGYYAEVSITGFFPIPDVSPAGITIALPATAPPGFEVSAVTVGLVVEHPWQGELTVHVEHGGRGADLIDRPGSAMWGGTSRLGYDADNFGNPASFHMLMLDDLAPTSINLYDGPLSGPGTGIDNLTGAWRPTDPLGMFTGSAPGEWSFTFTDHEPGNAGTVRRIYMLIEYATIPAPGGLAIVAAAVILRSRRRR